jgi:hypothetical protein
MHSCKSTTFDRNLVSLDLLHKSEKGEAFADKNLEIIDKFGRKCFAPTAKY